MRVEGIWVPNPETPLISPQQQSLPVVSLIIYSKACLLDAAAFPGPKIPIATDEFYGF